MADTKISELGSAAGLDGTELVPVVQSGNTVQTTANAIANQATNMVNAIALPGYSGFGIKTDSQATPAYGWRDITSDVTVRGGGSNDPDWTTYRNGINQYRFSSVGDEAWFNFHMPHDWASGSDIYIHAHWSHNSGSVTTGSVTWTFETTWAKGFDQAAFGATVSPTASQNASTTQYQHMVAEVQLTAASPSASQIDTDLLETDGLFLVHVTLSANSMDGGALPFLHTVDLHYQSTNMATPNKAPNFFSPGDA